MTETTSNDDGQKNIVTKGNKLSMAVQVASLATILVTISLAWGKVDARVSITERELETVKAQNAEEDRRARENRDLLVELRNDMKNVKEILNRMAR